MLVVPAEFRSAAHPRSSGNGQQTGFEISIQHTRLEQLDSRGAIDVSLDLAADDD
jgi:hypothetical protein